MMVKGYREKDRYREEDCEHELFTTDDRQQPQEIKG